MSAAKSVVSALLVLVACKGQRQEPAPKHEPTIIRARDAGADLRPQRIVLDQIAIKSVDPAHPHELYPRIIAQELGRSLRDSGWFYADAQQVPADVVGRHADLEVVVTYDVVEDGGRRAVVAAVESRIDWADDSVALAPSENLVAERVIPAGDDLAAAELDRLVAGHVGAAVLKVGEGLITKEAIRSGPDSAARAALTHREPDVVDFALDVIAERRLLAARDEVLALIDRPDPVRLRAVGTLMVLGGADAVDPLVKKARFDDLELMRAVVEAVGTLGGNDARQYLEFVASGHPDEAVRAHAASALARLSPASPP